MKKTLTIFILMLTFLTSCNQVEVSEKQEIIQTTITEEWKTNLLKDVKDTELRQLFEDYIDSKNGWDIQNQPILIEKLQELENTKGEELRKAQVEKDDELMKQLRIELRVIRIIQM